MSFRITMGTLGSGKTSFAVSEAYAYLKKNRRVVANFDLDFTSFPAVHPDSYVLVLPDIPRSADLHALGRGGPSEHEAGLLIIDEGAFCLNSRQWADKERQGLIEWFALSRKLGWDVILIIQHIQALDKQVRLLFGESLVLCKRLDKLKLMGIIPLPKVHLAVTRYGTEATAPVSGRTFFRPKTIGAAYDTNKLFDPAMTGGPFCTLTRRLAVLRYQKPKQKFYIAAFMFCLRLIMAVSLMAWARTTDYALIQKKLGADYAKAL